MEWLSLLLAAVLFAAACNLDTVILSMGYAVKGVRVSLSHSLIIAALTTPDHLGLPAPGGQGRPGAQRAAAQPAGRAGAGSGHRGVVRAGLAAPPGTRRGRRKGKPGRHPLGCVSWPPPWR